MASVTVRSCERLSILVSGALRSARNGQRSSSWWRLLSAVASESTSPNIPEPPADTDVDKLKLNIEKLNKDVTSLEEKCQQLDDKYKRALAEGENMRRRLLKQVEDAKLYGIQGFCKDLLDVADILGKATESVPKEEVNDTNPHLKSLYEGLTMTEVQLQQVFRRHGLVTLNPLHEKFDPNFHEALFQQETGEQPPGTVIAVSKIGYKLHDRVVRPALVGVSKGL